MSKTKHFVPAAGYDFLTGIYDPVVALTTRERVFKQRLIAQAAIRDNHAVLDLACGTGTLAVWIKRRVPGAHVVGVDGDPKILARAKVKAERHKAEIVLDQGYSTDLPYDDDSYDRVVSSLFFHHLLYEDKIATIREVCRVLKPGGEFHVADWGKPQNPLMYVLFQLVRLLDGMEITRDNMLGKLPEYFKLGGFEGVETRDEISTPLGTMALYAMRKPGGC